MPDEEIEDQGVADEESPDLDAPEDDPSPGDETPGVESEESEAEWRKALKKQRAAFFKEKQSLEAQIRDLTEIVRSSQTRTQPPEEGDSQSSVEKLAEKYRPLIQQDYVKGTAAMMAELVSQDRAGLAQEVSRQVVEQSALRSVDQRIRSQYPELDPESEGFNPDFFGHVKSRIQQLASEFGRPVEPGSILEASLIRTAAAEVSGEHPEMRAGKTRQRAIEDARIRGRGNHTLPRGESPPRKPKPELPELDETDLAHIQGFRAVGVKHLDISKPEVLERIRKRKAELSTRLQK